MNLSDLRDELSTRADDLGPTTDLRAGVAHGVRRTKRRRAVATGSAATLAVAALAVGVLTSVGRPTPPAPATTPSTSAAPIIGSDGMPFRSVPDAPGDVVKDGLRLRARVADDTLVAGAISDRGQAARDLAWTPTTARVSLGADCWIPSRSPEAAMRAVVELKVAGEYLLAASCGSQAPDGPDLPAGGGLPGEPGQGWDVLTVGKPTSATVRVVDRDTHELVTDPDVQVVGSVYEVGPETSVRDVAGTPVVALPDVVEHEGYRYRIASVTSAALASGPLPRVAAPSGPALVTWGSSGDGLVGATATANSSLRLTGLQGSDQGRGLGSWGTTPVPAGSTGTLALAAEGSRPDHGTSFLALYTLIP
ncbi:hypothetical protein GCM10023258_02320 [Terrabacter aeriphilus]|uniref:Uncharacterized protein n=1 Tax=Terrabacter aeriphilus TaxID=515662 RepID=A0ABP9J0S7_9MICO